MSEANHHFQCFPLGFGGWQSENDSMAAATV